MAVSAPPLTSTYAGHEIRVEPKTFMLCEELRPCWTRQIYTLLGTCS